MSEKSPRYSLPTKDADLIRRAIGMTLRPRKTLRELADENGADYDVLRDFLRSKSSSFRTVEDRETIRRCAEMCLGSLGLTLLAEAETLPPYSPRRARQKDNASPPLPFRLLLHINNIVKNVPEKSLNDAAINLHGAFNCYRIIEDKVVKSKIYIYRRPDAKWLEFIELWSRDGSDVEYDGYIFPTTEFLYFFGINRKYGVPRTIIGRTITRKGQPLHISGIVTGHSPTRGKVVSSRFFMEKIFTDFTDFRDFRRRVTLSDTGDIDISQLPQHLILLPSQNLQDNVSVQSESF